jgi:hypothetical protein
MAKMKRFLCEVPIFYQNEMRHRGEFYNFPEDPDEIFEKEHEKKRKAYMAAAEKAGKDPSTGDIGRYQKKFRFTRNVEVDDPEDAKDPDNDLLKALVKEAVDAGITKAQIKKYFEEGKAETVADKVRILSDALGSA